MRRRLIEDQFADECSGVAVHGRQDQDDEVDAEYGFVNSPTVLSAGSEGWKHPRPTI